MDCTDIVGHYYGGIVQNYKKYIGQSLKKVMQNLAKSHIILPYQIALLQDNDVVIWENKKDKNAHVTVFNDNKFLYSSPQGVKKHPVMLKYKKILRPKYIIRLGE